MHKPTPDERTLRDRRRSGFEKFLKERMPVLTDFFERLGETDPAMVLVDAERFLIPLEQFIKDQLIDDDSDDRVWIHARLGYYIGELFVQRYRGCWLLNENPGSRFYLQYVIGQFTSADIKNPNAMLDPFEAANAFLSEKPGRILSELIENVDKQLLDA